MHSFFLEKKTKKNNVVIIGSNKTFDQAQTNEKERSFNSSSYKYLVREESTRYSTPIQQLNV